METDAVRKERLMPGSEKGMTKCRKYLHLIEQSAISYIARIEAEVPTMLLSDIYTALRLAFLAGREQGRIERIKDIKLFLGKDDDEI